VERKKFEQVLDQVASKWFVGIEGPTKTAKQRQSVAIGKEKQSGYPQLMNLKPKIIICPACGGQHGPHSLINLREQTQKFECGLKRPFFRL